MVALPDVDDRPERDDDDVAHVPLDQQRDPLIVQRQLLEAQPLGAVVRRVVVLIKAEKRTELVESPAGRAHLRRR